MKLEEAKEIIENEVDGCDIFSCEMCKRDCTCDNSPCVEKGCQLAEAIDTVLQELEHLQKENEELREEIHNKIIIAPGRRKKINTYEFGLVVGTKREREYWEKKIKEKIETLEKQEKEELEPKDVLVLPKDTAYLSVKAEYYHKKNVLEELLKGE